MPMIVRLFHVHRAPNVGIWHAPGIDRERIETAVFSTDPIDLHFDNTDGPEPTFGFINGLNGLLVAKLDDHQIHHFANQAGTTKPLTGDADGYHLISAIPLRNIVNEDAPETPDMFDNTDPRLIPEGLFRAWPHEHLLLCGDTQDTEDEPITDLDDYNNMTFPQWLHHTNHTGITLTPIRQWTT